MEKYSPILEALDAEYAEDDLYNQVAQHIIDQTNEYTDKSGVIICPDAATALIAQDILSDVYNTEIKPLQQDSEYDLVYHVVFNKDIDESKEGWIKRGKKGWDFGLGGIKFMSDKGSDKAVAAFNHAATPAGDMPSSGMAMGESYDEPEEEIDCPICGGYLTFVGGQGKYWEYNCYNCGEWLYMDHNGEFYTADEVWNEDTVGE